MLISYSVRNMLWLRWFAVGAAIVELPYFLLQRNVLWPPIFWAVVFIGINGYQIAAIYRQRRPVVLSRDEQELYDLAFRSVSPREFVSLVLAGEWKTAAPGDQPVAEGKTVDSVCIALGAPLRITRNGKELGTVQPGQTIGLAPALTGHPSPVSASFTKPGRYIQWRLSDIREFLEAKPELRGAIQALVNQDLAAKVEGLLAGESASVRQNSPTARAGATRGQTTSI